MTMNNRAIVTADDGSRQFRLHDTAVAVLRPDGTLILDDGGWVTATTRRAMAQGVRALTGRPCAVSNGKQHGYNHQLRFPPDGEPMFFDHVAVVTPTMMKE